MAVRVTRAGTAFVNWYVVDDGGRVTIVDAGLPAYEADVAPTLASVGRSLEDVEALVLTHLHPDHVGFAAALHDRGVAVWAPEGEEPPADPLPQRVGRLVRFLLYLRHREARRLLLHFVRAGRGGRRVEVARTYGDGDTLDVPGRPLAVSTPGHTTPHATLVVPGADAVFVGDALGGHHPLTGRPGPLRYPRVFNRDETQALASLDRLEPLDARHVYFGHGDPWSGGIREAVERARAAGPT